MNSPAQTASKVRIPSPLTEEDASKRLAIDGRNELATKPRKSLAFDLFRRVGEPLNLTLVIVGVLTAVVLDERVQGSTIIALAIVNTLVGGVLERRADDAAAELGRMMTRRARVIRDDDVRDIATTDLVVGDVVVLTAGDQVPADLELTETIELRIDESALTGESLPVEKALGGKNFAFSGTLVVAGTAQGCVTATGPRTRIGEISAMLSVKPTPTPLQRQLGSLTGRLGGLAVAVGVIAAGVTYWRTAGETNRVSEAVLVGIALALAAVPEGLPSAVTAALAFSGVRLARHGAIVRSLTALESTRHHNRSVYGQNRHTDGRKTRSARNGRRIRRCLACRSTLQRRHPHQR
jgi:P-type Ca2+ transporter type 2C